MLAIIGVRFESALAVKVCTLHGTVAVPHWVAVLLHGGQSSTADDH